LGMHLEGKRIEALKADAAADGPPFPSGRGDHPTLQQLPTTA
jgi:hypothetical protein